MKIQFYGAAQQVTGSKHLITTKKGTKILLDCGLFQGIGTTELNLQFGFNPEEVDYLILSHAHIDHTGLVPRLVKKGFSGQIFCTYATESLCEIMLLDSAHIQQKDLERVNERRKKRGEEELELLYDEKDVYKSLALFKSVGYNEPFYIEEGFQVEFFEAGHILGSAGVFITVDEDYTQKKLFFTGDIGRPHDKILVGPVPFPQADYIISESTYGNKLHEAEPDVKAHLLRIVHETCVQKRGKLIIPAFSIDRTQELIYALDQLESEGKLPRIDVYVDSPLSVKATFVMKRHEEDFNPEILQYIKQNGDAFDFPTLHYITEVQESKQLNSYEKPCIIISASGMAEAGRIKHHIANNVENPRNTILLVGYCSPDSLGGVLKSGAGEVRIFGEVHPVRASVEIMDSFSAHADYSEILEYFKCQDASKVKKLFLVHGELENQKAFKERLMNVGFRDVQIPMKGEGFTI